jgi:hypothetical protein
MSWIRCTLLFLLCSFLIAGSGCGKSDRDDTKYVEDKSAAALDFSVGEFKKSMCIIEYIGDNTKPIPSVTLITEEMTELDIPKEIVFENLLTVDGRASARGAPITTPLEMRGLNDAVRTVAESLTREGGPEALVVAFMCKVNKDERVFGSRIPRQAARSFYRKALDALEPNNELARKRVLQHFERIIPSSERALGIATKSREEERNDLPSRVISRPP